MAIQVLSRSIRMPMMSRTENTRGGAVVGAVGFAAATVVDGTLVVLATTVVDEPVLGATVVDGPAVVTLATVGEASLATATSAAGGGVSSVRDPGAKTSPSQATPAAIDPSRTACVAFSTYRESASPTRDA